MLQLSSQQQQQLALAAGLAAAVVIASFCCRSYRATLHSNAGGLQQLACIHFIMSASIALQIRQIYVPLHLEVSLGGALKAVLLLNLCTTRVISCTVRFQIPILSLLPQSFLAGLHRLGMCLECCFPAGHSCHSQATCQQQQQQQPQQCCSAMR
jgi:hypothetical protein